MRKTTFCLLATMLIAGLTSCKKEDNKPASTEKTTKDILIASSWRKSEYKENGTTMPFFGSCEMDDVLTFNTTHSIMDDGSTKCSTSTTFSDTYTIDADNKTMRWQYGSGEISFNSDKSAFTFKRTGGNTFEYIFVKR